MPRNPVAKHTNTFNRPATHKDRKKEQRRGYEKHKGNMKLPPDFPKTERDND